MIYVELKFPVLGTALPSQHGYLLFSAISKLIPEAHAADWLAIETIPGNARGDGVIQLNERARLKMRCPQERVPLLLQLAGKRLDIGNYRIRLGVPQISLLQPAASLYARCVTIKHHTEPESFLSAVVQKLDELGIKGKPEIGSRRVTPINDYTVVGFTVAVHNLNDEDSIRLQEKGIGGRRRMGCGFFVPIQRRENGVS